MSLLSASLELAPILRESGAPLVLVSGIGLVMMVVNARFMHVTDQIRTVLNESPTPETAEELRVLFQRARWLRNSLACLSGSVVSTSFLVLCVIISHLTSRPDSVGLVFLVLSAMLIGSAAVFFMIDVFHSLAAMRIALRQSRHQ